MTLKTGFENQPDGTPMLWAKTARGKVHLRADQVWIRASDGKTCAGPLFGHNGMRALSPEEAAMVAELPLVQQVGVVKVGA